MSDGVLLLLTLIWMAIVSPAGIAVVLGLVFVRDAYNGVSADVGAMTRRRGWIMVWIGAPIFVAAMFLSPWWWV
ncbi:hypothetical protein [Streptomyces sp. NPDC002088]|uniref:hypothetical protein n=1 Tax=Streptomyces sp. NPDC002088 TaxID=3154665 RepID=UPI003319137A